MTWSTDDLNAHAKLYLQFCPHFEENRIVNASYGDRIVKFIAEQKACGVLSSSIGHVEVARSLLGQIDKLDLPPIIGQAMQTIAADFPAISNAIQLEAVSLCP